MRNRLRGRAHRIADRVCDLGEHAAHTPPMWAAGLGDVPDDPIARDTWILRAGHVAAYRERWHIPDTNTTLLPPCDRGEQGRARAWVAHYLAQHPVPEPLTDDELITRTTRVGARLEALRSRLARTSDHTPDTERVNVDHEQTPESNAGPDLDVGL